MKTVKITKPGDETTRTDRVLRLLFPKNPPVDSFKVRRQSREGETRRSMTPILQPVVLTNRFFQFGSERATVQSLSSIAAFLSEIIGYI
jgi:hypothetical protein